MTQENAIANVMFELSPSLKVNVWLTGEDDAERLAHVYSEIRAWLGTDERARATLLAPRASTPAAIDAPPSCPVHNAPMKVSQSKAGGWYCTKKVGDGYCKEKVSA